MSIAIDIADAVTAELNAVPEDLAALQVTVVPKAVEITGSTRSASQYEIAVDIGIQKKCGKDLDTEVAALAALVDRIADYLRRRPLTAAPHAAWVGIANDPVYAPDHLANHRVFTSVLTVTYRAMK